MVIIGKGFFDGWLIFNPTLEKTLEQFQGFFQSWKVQKNLKLCYILLDILVQNATLSQEKTLDFQGVFQQIFPKCTEVFVSRDFV